MVSEMGGWWMVVRYFASGFFYFLFRYGVVYYTRTLLGWSVSGCVICRSSRGLWLSLMGVAVAAGLVATDSECWSDIALVRDFNA